MNKLFSSVNKRLLSLLLVIASTGTTFAQAQDESDLGKVFHIGVFIFFFLVFVVLLTLISYHNSDDGKVPTLVKAWRWINEKMTKATPIDQEAQVMLDHDYDGIKELDNVLPPWWKYLFYVTIVFSVIYILNYHITNVWALSEGEYKEEIKLAEIQRAELMGSGAFITEKNVTALTDPASLALGSEIFKKNCAACHGFKGEGLVGPNMTDEFWINGGGIKNIFRTVTNGVPEKGMLSWKAQLNPKAIQEVGSYILSLYGTNPPNPKAPQGTKWVDVASADSTKAVVDSTKKIETVKK
ncbi:MAG: c-type cytochrome [Ignavibacteriales bacterium]|nr:c-type cytochrome [Ignavibacteriales bacterium]